MSRLYTSPILVKYELLTRIIIQTFYYSIYSYSSEKIFNYNSHAVGIWSDMLGGFHLWWSSLRWNLCPESADYSEKWRETGQATQCCLHKWNVNNFMCSDNSVPCTVLHLNKNNYLFQHKTLRFYCNSLTVTV